MARTTLSNNGRIVIPKPFLNSHNWKPGQQFEIIDSDNGIFLRPVNPFTATTLAEVAASLAHSGNAKSLTEMEEAIRQGALEAANVVPQNFHEYDATQQTQELLKMLALSKKNVEEGQTKPVSDAFVSLRETIRIRRSS